MIFQAKRAASACSIVLAALVAAALLPSALGQISMRGFHGDLSSTDDKFLSLDLNGDGKADMLSYRPGGGFAGAYLSHGDGTFRQVAYTDHGTGYNGFSGDLSSTQDTFVVLDLNGDGKSDFLEYRPGSGYTIKCLSNGDGTVNCIFLSQPGQQYNGFKDAMTNGAERIVAMDLNHDGRSDFIVYTPGGGYARAYLSLANGNLQEVDLTINGSANASVGFAEDMRPGSVRVVPIDANGDGYADLLVYTPQYAEVRLYQNNRNNTFQRVDLAYGGSRSGGFTGNAADPNSHLIALDLNGDGKQDFLWWQAGSRTVIGYLSSGNGSFVAVNYQANGSTANGFQDNDNSSADTAVALDADGDGKQEFFWYSPGNNVATLYFSGASGALNGAVFYGSQLSASRSNGVVLPLNFLGQAASGFVSYIPGSGANGGTPAFNAYTLANGDRQSSLLGRLNTYNFYAYPGSFLTDLNWSIGNVPTKEIVMPGTHDAAMYDLLYGPIDISETQWGDIPYQLANGARYFDFRTGYYLYNNNFPLDANGKFAYVETPYQIQADAFLMYGHSSILTNYQPRDLINQIENWLIAHPNDAVYLDLTNQTIEGSVRNMGAQFVNELQHTQHPELIYTQFAACGSAHCIDPSVQPQNMSINQLNTKGGSSAGARLVLINTPDTVTKLGWGWQGVKDSQVGYCGSGVTYAYMEIDCINKGDSNAPSIQAVRPNYWAADASPNFTQMVAVLTPYGAGGGALAPLQFADGTPGISGFNNGGDRDTNSLNQQLINGSWNVNALNMVTIDGLGHDDVPSLLIKRNRQTWVNTHFFNNRSDNPAGALSIGSNGDIWAAGAGHSLTLFKYNRATGAWVAKVNGMANVKRLATDLQGGVWVVDGSQGTASAYGRLIHYDLNGQNATDSGFTLQDVAVGKNGSVWGISADGVVEVSAPTDGSRDLAYTAQNGSRVTVDNMGYPWVIDNGGHIQKFNGSSWQQVSGAQAREIVAGADGSIFIKGYDSPSIGRYNTQNNNFDFLQMDADRIAVEPGGQPWAIRHGTGTIYKGSLDQM